MLRFNETDTMAARITEGNQGIEILANQQGTLQTVHTMKQLVDHVTLVDYEESLYVIVGLEQHDIGFKTTIGCV